MSTDDEKGKDEPHRRARHAGEDAQTERDRRDDRLTPADGGAQDVSAVELPDRQQVQARHEQPEPRRHEDGMLVDGRARVGSDAPPVLRPANDQRVAEENLAGPEGGRVRQGMGDAVEQKRDRGEEAGERPRGADVEELSLPADRLLDPNHRAESADDVQKGRRDEIRKGRRDPVSAAHRVMPELVHAEDEEQGHREGEPVGEAAVKKRTASRSEDAARESRRHERGEQEPEVEERVLEHAAPAARRRHRLREGIGRRAVH